MATSQKSLADRRVRWTRLSDKGDTLANEMPELRQPLEELRRVAEEVRTLASEQSHHAAQAQILTARIRALSKHADHLRGRIGASLRGKYGFDGTELIAYGFKPRRQLKKDSLDRELAKEREVGGVAAVEVPGEGGQDENL